MGDSITISRSKLGIELMDSSGRNIHEVYGSNNNKRKDNKIVVMASELISEAIDRTSSDILIDPKNDFTYTVRYRIDGVLHTITEFESETCHAIINSIKAVAGMDIAERRRPQDGSFLARTAEGLVSFRAATAGVRCGEKLSIRVLNQDAGIYTLETVGLSSKQIHTIEKAIKKPSGMVMMCGPTGSGKTTSLYAMLNRMDLMTRNVITVEDPIEYVLEHASQIEVNPKADISFASSLRSILRQDPDVICVGEIRDEETASIALRAAQTGHLVLATIHSNSNAASIVRLLDLGVRPQMLASGLSVLVSQRLLRRLCEYCKIPAELSPAMIADFRKQNINYSNFYQPVGCDECHYTGYSGRVAVFDILNLTEELKASIATNDLLIKTLRKEGDQKGKTNLKKQAMKLVVQGVTSHEELERVIG
jgi:type II secretory ATPase GspE/PulE/Tfp pilus assembly ATPase PilB-like protein